MNQKQRLGHSPFSSSNPCFLTTGVKLPEIPCYWTPLLFLLCMKIFTSCDPFLPDLSTENAPWMKAQTLARWSCSFSPQSTPIRMPSNPVLEEARPPFRGHSLCTLLSGLWYLHSGAIHPLSILCDAAKTFGFLCLPKLNKKIEGVWRKQKGGFNPQLRHSRLMLQERCPLHEESRRLSRSCSQGVGD